eukprot:CAMPEP_0198209706 /NCGR_PEP_ID=MMETSP1445-20131203/17679_1 /TAXON_ID=36898 /ORGANISM="Pyramimonas sp., Strain CCMP2087" /LENGTH=242 /DNA_ID=CAMNT_0043883563 /DNA_START=274 /DNA_END=1002 /DNA_ORIENTATION=+
MAVVLASHSEFAKIEAQLDAAIELQVQALCASHREGEGEDSRSVVLRSRLETMKANVLQRFKQNIKYPAWEAVQSGDAAEELPPPPVVPSDEECKELEKEVQRLVESIADHRATVLPTLSKRVAADLAQLREATLNQDMSLDDAPDAAAFVLDPPPETLGAQLKAALAKIPELERRLEDVTNVTKTTYEALEANRKRAPPGALERALNSQLAESAGDGDEGGAARRQTRQRLVQDVRSSKLA